MRRSLLAVAMAVMVAHPASALDLGGKAGVGGIGVGAGVGLGRGGASLGLGADVGGIAGAGADASIGNSGAAVGADGNIGKTDANASAALGAGGVSASLGAGGSGESDSAAVGSSGSSPSHSGTATGRSADAGRETAGAATASEARTFSLPAFVRVTPMINIRPTIVLPRLLRPSPSGVGLVRPERIQPVPGTPRAVVQACRAAIASAAAPLGATRVAAASAGPSRSLGKGALSAPIEVRIQYARQGGTEIRQAKISCTLDAAGKVVAVS